VASTVLNSAYDDLRDVRQIQRARPPCIFRRAEASNVNQTAGEGRFRVAMHWERGYG